MSAHLLHVAVLPLPVDCVELHVKHLYIPALFVDIIDICRPGHHAWIFWLPPGNHSTFCLLLLLLQALNAWLYGLPADITQNSSKGSVSEQQRAFGCSRQQQYGAE
jgi:hypothetical protein